MAEDEDVSCVPCASDFDLPRCSRKYSMCGGDCANVFVNHDCGHCHVDATAPGWLRGVALPAFRLTLAMSLLSVAAATSSSVTSVGPVFRSAQVLVLGVCSITVLRALLTASPPPVLAPSDEDIALVERCLSNQSRYAENLSAALQCKTISYDESDPENTIDFNEFKKLHALLENRFPRVHKELKRTIINSHSLVFEWQGTQEAELPYMVYAHLDVVPAPEPEKWVVDPWAGEIKDGYVWGRGAIDDKQAVLGHLEAVEDLLSSGFKPRRTIFLCFGHDEEVSGKQGAKLIAEHLTKAGVHFEFMLDEGLFIIDGAVPGFTKPVAMVCVAEKGYLTLKLSVECDPGHASSPPSEGAIGILSRALSRLEKNPFPATMTAANRMFDALQGGFTKPMQIVFANMWLFSGLVKSKLGAEPQTSTLVRTTTALTVVNSGMKENVLPSQATALVNHRIHPDDSVEGVIERDRRIINDPRVSIDVVGTPTPASPVSSATHPAYQTISDCVHRIFPGNAVAPGLFVAASDSRHFWNLAAQIYRFNPITLHKSETNMFHGFNEKIGVENHAKLVAFFREFHVRQSSRPAVVEVAKL